MWQTTNMKTNLDKITLPGVYKYGKKLLLFPPKSLSPSSLTFYVVISFFPFLTLLTIFLEKIGINLINEYKDLFLVFKFPLIDDSVIISLSNNLSSEISISSIFFLITLFYISSKGVERFVFYVNETYGYPIKKEVFITRKIKSVFFTFVFCSIFTVLLQIYTIFVNFFKKNSSVFTPILLIITIILFIVILFTLIYSLTPMKKQKIRFTLPGAIFSTCSIIIGVNIYSYYLETYAKKEKIYGQFESIIVLLLTIYFIVYLIMIGVRINYFKMKKHS